MSSFHLFGCYIYYHNISNTNVSLYRRGYMCVCWYSRMWVDVTGQLYNKKFIMKLMEQWDLGRLLHRSTGERCVKGGET